MDRMTSTTTRRVIRGIAAVAVMSAVLSLALVAIHSPVQVISIRRHVMRYLDRFAETMAVKGTIM